MSAIFGIIHKTQRPANADAETGMKESLAHYAIHGRQYYNGNGCFLGHHQHITNNRQLAEQQPFRLNHLVITAFSQLTNHDTLAKQLGLPAGKETPPDPVLILEAFRKWGKDCVNHFEGEFTFVIWDEAERSLFGAADHIGGRSFYYYDSPDLFVFSSEIKAILAVKPLPHIFDEQEIITGITKGYTQKTFVKDVLLLRGGHTISLQTVSGPALTEPYWTLQKTGRYSFRTNEEWGECLRSLLQDFLRYKTDTTGNTGIMLSGGLDSSFVAGVAASLLREQNKTLYAFSGRLPDHYTGPLKDERYYQDLLAKHIPNLEMTYAQPDPSLGPLSNLEATAYQSEGIPNAYHYLDTLLYSLAQEKQVTILLNGFMGDHNVSRRGHNILYYLVRNGRLKLAADLYKQVRRNYGLSAWGLLKSDILSHYPLWKRLSRLRDRVYKGERVHGFNVALTDQITGLLKQAAPPQVNMYIPSFAVNNGVLGNIMTIFNKRCVWFGFDKASPFTDRHILEFCMDVPDEVMLSKGYRRGLIREAMDGIVPDEIRWRKDKSMFTPDFIPRLVKQKRQAEEILTDPAYAPYMHIADKEDIIATLQRMEKEAAGFNLSSIGAAFAVMSVLVMKDFTEKFRLSFPS